MGAEQACLSTGFAVHDDQMTPAWFAAKLKDDPDLLLRAADVSLKEGRKLVLVPRETPLNLIHINNMRKVAAAGATIVPPVLTMYTMPKSIDDLIEHIVGKVLDALGIDREDP